MNARTQQIKDRIARLEALKQAEEASEDTNANYVQDLIDSIQQAKTKLAYIMDHGEHKIMNGWN